MLTCAELRRCQPIGTAPDGGVWLWGHPEGDLSGLFHLSTAGRPDPADAGPGRRADLADLTVDPQDGRPRLLGWRSTVPRQAALEATDAPDWPPCRRASPAASCGCGSATRLVQEQADVLRGARWWLASADGEARAVRADARPRLCRPAAAARPDEAAMARKLPVRWTASGGRAGFVHLPPGADPARAPLVVLVHGGPHSLVRPDYSNDAQLLANRGYAVFQPNFRASTGLGRELMFAAQGDFGRGRVLADLVEGTRWLLAEGVGDPARVAIAGASFGGYAALLAATFEPALYQAAIAGVPPTTSAR